MEIFKPKPDLYSNLRRPPETPFFPGFGWTDSYDGGSTEKSIGEQLLENLGYPEPRRPFPTLARVDYHVLPSMTEQSIKSTIRDDFNLSDRGRRHFERFIKRFTPKELRALNLIMFSEIKPSLAGIAKELDCSPQEARMHIRRAYFKLRHPNRKLPNNFK